MELKLYKEAAHILERAGRREASLKTLIYSSKFKNTRQLYALVSECSKYHLLIKELLSVDHENILVSGLGEGSEEMAGLLLYEFLFGNKFGRAVNLRRAVQKHKMVIKKSVSKLLARLGVETLVQARDKFVEQHTSSYHPRFARVNLIKSSVEAVIRELEDEDWTFCHKFHIHEFAEKVSSMAHRQFTQDPLLFDVLVFPEGTDLHDHHLTRSGVLVLQDRASCVPAHVLDPNPGSIVLDCCSAPGNKTTHLASLMGDQGRIIALDRDSRRMLTMSRLVKQSGATCIEMIVQDFLTVQPDSDDASNVQFILVDPSCSGSGMTRSATERLHEACDDKRLQMLQRFQMTILKHALQFPHVERVVYSTCSIHEEENEQVAEQVLSQVSSQFQLVPVCPELASSRGLQAYPHGNLFLRLSPNLDRTQGFFVACFQRVDYNNLDRTERKKRKESSNDLGRLEMKKRETNNSLDRTKMKKIKVSSNSLDKTKMKKRKEKKH